MTPLVTIGIPIHKRLEFLPNVLRSVGQQDYRSIELIVSDNGLNGAKVPEIICQYYQKPFRFRQNPATATMSTHFNQIIADATGKYFMILCDDDEISANFISEMVALMEHYPQATVGLSKQDIMDESGRVVRNSSDNRPPIVSGPDFIKGLWRTFEYQFGGLVSFFSRTADLKACGGYPEFWKGHSHDDALVVKLCVDNYVAMSSRCTFRYRVYETSYGLSISIDDLARGTRELLHFMKSDPKLMKFAAAHPKAWQEVKDIVDRMNWVCYYERWNGMYRERLSLAAWLKAAFSLPFISNYYAAVTQTLLSEAARYLDNKTRAVRATLRS